MKKFVSVLLALAMTLALSVSALAAGTNSITVTGAQAGETYKIYKMLDLSVNEDKTAYTYTVNAAWEGFFKTPGAGAAYVDINNQGYVTWKTDKKDAASMEAFGKAAAAYAAEKKIAPAADAQTPAEDGEITFRGLDSGYYLITSTNGTLAMVDTTPTNPDATVEEKNPDSTIDKQVQEDFTGNYGDKNDADIGQTVNFQVTINVKKGAKNYVMHDQMTAGLTFNADSVKVFNGANEVSSTNYTVKTTGMEDSCTFEIEFKQDYLDTITADTTLTVKYSATLNKNAQAGVAEINKAKLTWGDNGTTAWDETKTYTWDMEILKFGDGKKENVLKDAQFVLLNEAKSKVATFDNGKFVAWVDVPAAVDNVISWPTNAVLTTGEDGKIKITGLDSDTYYLREVKAPAGYNILADDVKVTITATDGADGKTLTYTLVTAEINNQSGTELPSTGGMGTTIFYVLGGVLMAGAFVLLVVRKRMRTE